MVGGTQGRVRRPGSPVPRLGDAPGGDLYEVLNVARSTLSEGIDILDDAVRRFRAGEHRVA